MPRYTWIEKSLHQVDSEAEHPLEEKETGDLHLSSLFISDSIAGGGMALELPVLTTGKMGKVFSLSQLITEWETERDTWNWERILSWKNVHRSQELFCGIQLLSTAEWPLFYKLELYRVTCYSLCRQTVNPLSRLIWSQLSEKPRALPIASYWRG